MIGSRLLELRDACEAAACSIQKLYEAFGSPDILIERHLLKPPKNMFRRQYQKPVFSVPKRARAHLPK